MSCSNCGLRSWQERKEVTCMKYLPHTDETARFLKQRLRSIVKYVCVYLQCDTVWQCFCWCSSVTEEGRHTQDGHHSRVLRGKKCSHHGGHRLYGESTSGEAATLLFRCQSCLCACPAQSRTGAWCPYCWHDQLQGEQVQVWRIAEELHGFFSQFSIELCTSCH